MEVGIFHGEAILRKKKKQTKPPQQTQTTHTNRKATKLHYSSGGPLFLITKLPQSDIVSV